MFALIKQGGLYVPRPINPPPLEGVNESCAVSNALCHLNEFGGLYLNVPKVPPPPPTGVNVPCSMSSFKCVINDSCSESSTYIKEAK